LHFLVFGKDDPERFAVGEHGLAIEFEAVFGSFLLQLAFLDGFGLFRQFYAHGELGFETGVGFIFFSKAVQQSFSLGVGIRLGARLAGLGVEGGGVAAEVEADYTEVFHH